MGYHLVPITYFTGTYSIYLLHLGVVGSRICHHTFRQKSTKWIYDMFDIWVISFPTTWCMVNLQIYVFHLILGPQAPPKSAKPRFEELYTTNTPCHPSSFMIWASKKWGQATICGDFVPTKSRKPVSLKGPTVNLCLLLGSSQNHRSSF